jgi:beta-galactosidase
MDMGPVIDWRKTSVPTVPPDSAFAQAATWQLQVKDPNLAGLSELFLNIDYSGDIGRVSGKVQGATTLLDDNFYNGLPWQIGLIATDTTLNEPLTLSILPLPKIAPIYLDNHARALIHQSPKNPHLANATLIPEYESILPLLP